MPRRYPEGSGAQILQSPAVNVNPQIAATREKKLKTVTVSLKETVSDLIQSWIMVLTPLVGDLNSAHN